MSNNEDKNKVTYTKDMLIKQVARKCNFRIDQVKEIYNLIEEEVFEVLSTTTPDTDVSVRMFEGYTIDSTFVPEKTKVNNLTGKPMTTASKIKPKVTITRNYCDKLTENMK